MARSALESATRRVRMMMSLSSNCRTARRMLSSAAMRTPEKTARLGVFFSVFFAWIAWSGLEILGVKDVTPQAHNGVRPRKRRRV